MARRCGHIPSCEGKAYRISPKTVSNRTQIAPIGQRLLSIQKQSTSHLFPVAAPRSHRNKRPTLQCNSFGILLPTSRGQDALAFHLRKAFCHSLPYLSRGDNCLVKNIGGGGPSRGANRAHPRLGRSKLQTSPTYAWRRFQERSKISVAFSSNNTK